MNSANGASGAGNGSLVAAILGAVVHRRVAGNLLMLLMLGGGLLVASSLDVTMGPDIDTKQITVTVPYPGSSPSEIEASITRRMEERLIGLGGVRRVTSHASAGVGRLRVDVEQLADTDEVLERVRTAIERIEGFPPPDAERAEVAVTARPLEAMTLAVSSAELSPEALRGVAERLRENLLALPGVSNVALDWSPGREIAIDVSEEALREYGLSIDDVAGTLRRLSVDLTSGQLFTPEGGLVVRVTDRVTEAGDFENLALLAQANGGVVRLGDVAEVRERFGEPTSLSELNGAPAVFVTAMATEDGLTEVEVAEQVRLMLAGYEPPPGVELTVWDDTSWQAYIRLNVVVSIGILGLALVFIFLALVFDLRLALWVAAGLPTSFLGALIFFPAFDLTLNFIVIFGLIIMIGIVVDDAIVVGESIARERELGLEGTEAAVAGARRVFWPVVVGVTTTFLAFAPLLFTQGTLSAFVQPVAIVVGLVLAMSLVEAFLILPSHLAAPGNWSRGPLSTAQSHVRRWIDDFRDRWVVTAIAFATRNPIAMVTSAIAILVIAVALVATGTVRYAGYVEAPLGIASTRLTYPTGTPLAVTSAGARQVAEAARRANDRLADSPVQGVAMIVGHHGRSGGADDEGTHLAVVTVRLRDESERVAGIHELGRIWREEMGEVVGAERVEISFTDQQIFSTETVGMRLALIHPNEAVLREATGDFMAAMENVPGVLDIHQSRAPGRRHFDLELTSAGRAAGLTADSLATQLRARFFGSEVQRIQRGRDEIRVMVRYPEEQRRSFAELLDERVALPSGGEIPLALAATVLEREEPETLTRIDGVPTVEINLLLSADAVTRTEMGALLRGEILPDLLARHAGLDFRPLGTGEDEFRAMASLAYTVPIALLAMYMLMAVQFRSYAQPLVILTGVPAAAAGAVFGHLLLGYDLTFVSVYGIVAVLGVGINDTLLLIDRYNILCRGGSVPAIAAISGAIRDRFRPVLITTLTTILGLLPALYMTSELTLTNVVPMVVSIIGGLILCSASILFVVPAILLLGEGLGERLAMMRARAAAAA